MPNTYDYGGATLTGHGRYKVIVPASTTTTRITGPNQLNTAAYADGVLSNASPGVAVSRICGLIIASGTGAVTIFDADSTGHCDAAHTVWSQGTTVSGTPFVLDFPIALGLFITTAASTQVVVSFS